MSSDAVTVDDLFSYVNTKGVRYYLNHKVQVSERGKKSQLYYFTREPGEHSTTEMPEGREIFESGKGCFPMLRKMA